MKNQITELSPKAVWKYFYDLTQIPRPTGHTKEVENYIIDFAKKHNLEYKHDEVGNVLVIKSPSKAKESVSTVILQAHLDMVPQKNSDIKHDFLKDPIETYIDGNLVKARSTTLGADNGIGVAAILAVLADNSLSHGKIEALFTIDEEEGMDGAFGLKPGFLSGSILLNLDSEEEGELCIGCAGGIDENITWQFKEVEVPEGDVAVKISLTGLRGGHSGGEIDQGRANANKLLFRLLKQGVKEVDARLSSVNGGSLRNAIPREAFAIVTVPKENVETLYDLIAEYADIYKTEYNDIEPSLWLRAEDVELPTSLIPDEIQDNIINAVEASPNGVISMLSEFPYIVETSTNLASVQSSKEMVEVKFLTRSSSETRKEALDSSIESLFSLAGAKVEAVNSYPGWAPKAESKVRDIMKTVYNDKYKKDPIIKVLHAGLECGIILDSTPGLDIVSFGPTIMNPHSPDEYVEIDSVQHFYNYLLSVLEHIK